MRAMHATAEQAIESNVAGLNEYHPITGPYWNRSLNQISREEDQAILEAAVMVVNKMPPDDFGQAVFDACMGE